ncbi:MAG: ABC transporter permease, partial [Clostridiales bacterium]
GRLPMGANFVADGTGFILVDTLMAGRVDLFWMALKQMTLPVITIVLETLAAICKLTRSSMISTMNMEYIKMARASGIPSTIIYGRYSLKNGLLPVITSVGMTFSFAVGGEVLVEKIFSWPGIGLYAIKALGVSDYPAIQGFVLTCALIYLVVFLIVDLLYFAVDPRIKY